MSYKNRLLFYQTITPLHVGCGQDVGVVDLPVIRERTTGYPFVPGSGIRGSLRDVFRRLRPAKEVSLLFGPDADESETGPRYAGCVAVHDARILLFPVRSDQAPFVWITCPAVLERFSRDTGFLLDGAGWTVMPGDPPGEEQVIGPFENKVHLEEFEMTVQGGTPDSLSALLAKLAGPLAVPDLAERVALVSNRTFHYFITHATQILQHNRLTAAKTVAQGQLFSVEAVPPETVFYSFLGATDPRRPKPGKDAKEEPKGEEPQETIRTRDEALAALTAPFSGAAGRAYLQLGGDEGTGLGITRLAWAEAPRAPEAGHAS